jgi:hypothetical protein
MNTAERQYHDMEAMTRGAVENWTIDTAEHVVSPRGHGHDLRGQLVLVTLYDATLCCYPRTACSMVLPLNLPAIFGTSCVTVGFTSISTFASFGCV